MRKSYEEANKVAKDLGRKYKNKNWFRGAAAMYDDEVGDYVEIRIAPETNPTLPSSQEGVVIRTDTRLSAKALRKKGI